MQACLVGLSTEFDVSFEVFELRSVAALFWILRSEMHNIEIVEHPSAGDIARVLKLVCATGRRRLFAEFLEVVKCMYYPVATRVRNSFLHLQSNKSLIEVFHTIYNVVIRHHENIYGVEMHAWEDPHDRVAFKLAFNDVFVTSMSTAASFKTIAMGPILHSLSLSTRATGRHIPITTITRTRRLAML